MCLKERESDDRVGVKHKVKEEVKSRWRLSFVAGNSATLGRSNTNEEAQSQPHSILAETSDR